MVYGPQGTDYSLDALLKVDLGAVRGNKAKAMHLHLVVSAMDAIRWRPGFNAHGIQSMRACSWLQQSQGQACAKTAGLGPPWISQRTITECALHWSADAEHSCAHIHPASYLHTWHPSSVLKVAITTRRRQRCTMLPMFVQVCLHVCAMLAHPHARVWAGSELAVRRGRLRDVQGGDEARLQLLASHLEVKLAGRPSLPPRTLAMLHAILRSRGTPVPELSGSFASGAGAVKSESLPEQEAPADAARQVGLLLERAAWHVTGFSRTLGFNRVQHQGPAESQEFVTHRCSVLAKANC